MKISPLPLDLLFSADIELSFNPFGIEMWEYDEPFAELPINIVPERQKSLVFDSTPDKISFPIVHTQTPQSREVYDLYSGSVSVAFSPDGRYLATGDTDGDVGLWEVSSGDNIYYKGLGGSVEGVAFSPDGSRLAADGNDGSPYVALLDVSRETELQRTSVDDAENVRAVAYSPDGRYVAIGADVPWAWLWNLRSGNRYGWGNTGNSEVKSVAFSPDGTYLATGDDNGEMILWEVSRWWSGSSPLAWRRDVGGNVRALAFSPDGKYLAADGYDGSNTNVTIYDVSKDTTVWQIDPDIYEVYALAFSPNGEYLAVGGDDERITFYRIGADITKKQVILASGQVNDLAWSPDGTLISDGKKVYRTLIDRISAEPLSTPRDVNRDGVIDVADLVLVASNFGKSFTKDANPNPDVNGDGVVNRADIIEIIISLEAALGAPSAHSRTVSTLTAEKLQRWISYAKQVNRSDPTFQRGIAVLEQLLAALLETQAIPAETTLLSNYPNPFNPETWIPYHLANAADVRLTIYNRQGGVVRQFDLEYQLAGYYTDRVKSIYWDGRNDVGEQVASGVYFYHLSAGDYFATRRMVILK